MTSKSKRCPSCTADTCYCDFERCLECCEEPTGSYEPCEGCKKDASGWLNGKIKCTDDYHNMVAYDSQQGEYICNLCHKIVEHNTGFRTKEKEDNNGK